MADIFNFYVYDDRSIQFTLAEPIMLEDKDVTQFRFRIPKSLNGFDMSDWEWWFIFVNPKGTKYTTLLELTDDEDEPDDYSVATYTVGYGFSGIVGTVRFSIEALNVSGEEIVNEWHTKTYSTAVIDTLQGLRAVIPEPDGQVSTGITEEVKQALLQIARKVAYIDEHGQTYYNALYDALYAITAVTVSPRSLSLSAIGQTSQLTAQTTPAGGTITWSTSNASVATVTANGLVTATGLGSATITATSGGKSSTCSVLVAEATLTEISAVYTPSGTVYESDSLDSLKSRLVVTAHWSNGTTSEVASADYTLSGTLQRGTSIITVSYGGMTDTFEVDVAGLTGVYAQYTQSGTVYDTDTLDSLKDDLYVYASYSDMTTRDLIASEYTLSGTLTIGTSTIMVSYGGKTASFNVTVTDYNAVDYTINPLDGITWHDGYTYNQSTGVLTATSGEHCTDRFDGQSCVYIFQNSDTSNNRYFAIFAWDETGAYIGYSQYNASLFSLKKGYKYAIKVYNTAGFNPTTLSFLPKDNTQTATAEFSIKLADYVDSITVGGGGRAEFKVTALMNTMGITVDNLNTKINKCNISTVLSPVSTSEPFVNRDFTFWFYNINTLMFKVSGATTLDAIKTYIANNDPTIIFNKA